MKRIELLTQSQESREQEELQNQVEQDKLQLKSDQLATQQALAKAKQKLSTLKSAAVLSPANIIAQEVVVDDLDRGLKALNKLEKELF